MSPHMMRSSPAARRHRIGAMVEDTLLGSKRALTLLLAASAVAFGANAVLEEHMERLHRQALVELRAHPDRAADVLAARLAQHRGVSQVVEWVVFVLVSMPAVALLLFQSRMSHTVVALSAESGRRRDLLIEKIQALRVAERDSARTAADLRRAQIALSSERREVDFTASMLATAMASVHLGVAFISSDRRFLRVNARFAALHEQPTEWFGGRSVDEAVPTHAAEVTASVHEVIEKGLPLVRVEMSPAHIGGPVQWIASYAPFRDAGEAIVGVVVVLEDATEHTLLRAKFEHVQKLEAVGRLASGVAHDVKNLLVVIQSYADLMLAQPELQDKTSHLLHELRSVSGRATELTQQLLSYTRRSAVAPRAIDVRPRLRELQAMLAPVLRGGGVEMTVTLPDHLDEIVIDPGHFDQMLMNLAVNAIDAMPRGGRLHIVAAGVDADAVRAVGLTRQTSGPCVMITVTDTGDGMDAATVSRCFEPFFSTKPVGEGTGLGLSTIAELAAQYHGFVQVESEERRGTTFRLLLPVAAVPPGAFRQGLLEVSPSGDAGNTPATNLSPAIDASAHAARRSLPALRDPTAGVASDDEFAEDILANAEPPIRLLEIARAALLPTITTPRGNEAPS